MIDAQLWVDGRRAADGAAADDPDAPTVLTGLTVTWGRTTTIDQPEPAACSFDVVAAAGSGTFLGMLYAGCPVQVRAAADVTPPAQLPANEDPSFEAAAVGSVLPWLYSPTTPRAVVVDAAGGYPAATGNQSALLQTTAASGWVHIPPAAVQATDPTAWDHLPTLAAGQVWTGSVTLIVPPGAVVTARAGLYRNSADRAPAPAGAAYRVTGLPGLTWQTAALTLTGTADTAGRWVGLYLQVKLPDWNGYPAGVAWQDVDPAWTWTSAAEVRIDDARVLAPDPAATVRREVIVFEGRISEVNARWDDALGKVRLSAVAVDFTADLANRDAADVPWPAETVAARVAHIMAAAGLTIPTTIDPALASQVVSWMDVDRQQVLPLLTDLATSVDGVLWAAVHAGTGPYLYLLDPAGKSALYELDVLDGVVVIVPTQATDAAVVLQSADVIRDQVVFRQAIDDIITRASVTWREQTLNAGLPAPTDRELTVADAALELELGTRRLGISTQLTTQNDAQTLAARVLARLREQSWRVAGLTWATWLADPSADADARALDILDGTRRLGVPILLTGLPAWAPFGPTLPLFLQGGTFSFEAGDWQLDLTTATAQSQGTSLAWNQVDPGYSWEMFDPGITWTDLTGVAP